MERRGVDNTSCKLYVGNYTGTGSAPCALKYKWDPVIYTDVKTCFTDAVLYRISRSTCEHADGDAHVPQRKAPGGRRFLAADMAAASAAFCSAVKPPSSSIQSLLPRGLIGLASAE